MTPQIRCLSSSLTRPPSVSRPSRSMLSFLLSGSLFAGAFSKKHSVLIIPLHYCYENNRYCELMVAKSAGRGIVIYQDKITPMATKVISEVSHSYHLESFQEADLLVNITEHTLVPEHIVLSSEEKETLLKR